MRFGLAEKPNQFSHRELVLSLERNPICRSMRRLTVHPPLNACYGGSTSPASRYVRFSGTQDPEAEEYRRTRGRVWDHEWDVSVSRERKGAILPYM